MTPRHRFAETLAIALIPFCLAACDVAQPVQSSEAEPAQVSVVTLKASPRPYIRELPGRIAPTRIAEVRARVSGIVIERPFKQGSEVKAGDILYRIDPAPFQIELQAAEAAHARTEAARNEAAQQLKRFEALLPGQAISRAQYDTAVSTHRQAEADVAARKADIARARLNLEYATVRAPISGRVDGALVSEGALVGVDVSGQGQATHLATVQQLDPIYADFTQSVGELRQLKRALQNGDLEKVEPEAARVRLKLDDGTIYAQPGKLLFSGVTVDPSTGQVTLRGEFPNHDYELLPGMYVRVQIEHGIDSDALAVPQQAIQRNASGASEVYVVRDDNTVVAQPVRTGSVVDDRWLLLDGVKPGDRVVVEGFQKISAGTKVVPLPWRDRHAASLEPGRNPP